ncbi:MAG TPA: hemerythrin domain-containing protein, partial [Nitrospira sp.]|nr:hemerythrin domain-containing protein [Nitrospira sp.]
MVRRTSKKTPAGQAASHAKDAVQTLKADHRKVRKLFDRFRTSSDSEKSDLARRLFAELDLHTKLEEELIYPALRAGVGEASFDRPSLGNGLDLDATGDS